MATFILAQATAERSERYISSFERTDLRVPLEVELEETQSSGADGDIIDRHVSAPGAVYNVKIWSINGAYFSTVPLLAAITLLPHIGKEIARIRTVHTLVYVLLIEDANVHALSMLLQYILHSTLYSSLCPSTVVCHPHPL